MPLPLLAQVRFEGLTSGFVTDHNRRATQIAPEEIKNARRMANGTLRERFITSKNKYQFTFEDLPSIGTYTVDGYWAGEEIIAFWKANRSFTLKLFYSGSVSSVDSPEESVVVMWDDPPTWSISARNPQFDLWDLSFTLVEA